MDISKAQEILDYWFHPAGVYTPDFDKWFMKSQDYDEEIKEKFGELLKEAELGKGYGWLVSKDSFIAYIILMDQFSRHIYRGTGDSFKNDKGVMIFTELGFEMYKDDLIGYEFMFAFMPYMHTESLLYQKKGKTIFESHFENIQKKKVNNLMQHKNTDITISETELLKQYNNQISILNSMKTHLDGHFNVILNYGRFPKRNNALGRISTTSEIEYMNQEHVRNRPY